MSAGQAEKMRRWQRIIFGGDMVDTGVIHGRFQLLHNDHMKYLLAGKERCNHLVVGITNPDPTLTKSDSADSHRSAPAANPLTYWERYQMVRAALTGEGLGMDEFSVVPLPINFPELYQYYVPLDATFFLTIYDQWGERKLEMFKSLGLATEVMWRRPLEQKGLSATHVRRRIVDDDAWQKRVPAAVAQLVEEWGLKERFKVLAQEQG